MHNTMQVYVKKSILAVRAYGQSILHRKLRIILGAAVSLALFLFSSHYLFDGFHKRFIIYSALSLLTGAFIILPRFKSWYLSIPVVLLYLVYVPQKMFERIELPVHDLSQLIEGSELVNIMIIYLIFAFFLLILRRVNLAFGVSGILLLVLMTANYYVREFRGSSMNFQDILAINTAASVIKSYKLTMNGELWYSILYFLFFISMGFWCKLPREKGIWYQVPITVVPLIYMGIFWNLWSNTDYLDEHQLHGIHWEPQQNQPMEGFLLSFGLNMQEMFMERPAGYSENTLAGIAREAEESYQSPDIQWEKAPNIIFIMNEAWSDLKILGNLETSEPYMPFLDSLEENTQKGWLDVEILGGLTANTEFEALTGDSLAFLSPYSVPYQLQVNHDMPSIARVLGEQGYQTMAMHPSIASAWNRDKVYNYLGFDEFVDVDKFQTEYEYVGPYISDQCNYNEIIWQFEHKKEDTPLFLFDVTIQNHAGYGGSNYPLKVEKIGEKEDFSGWDLEVVEDYLYLVKISDDAFANLITYFASADEPVIVCMFGDHQPLLGDAIYDTIFEGRNLTQQEQGALKYIVPYVIWTNRDVELPQYGNMSANYLGAAILECAGAKLPPYYQYLLQLRKDYPVISYRNITEIKDDKAVIQYQMLQYNQLMERRYFKDLFLLRAPK